MEDARWGERPEREGRIKELVGGENQGPKALSRSKKGKRRGSKGDVRRGVMQKGGCVRVMEEKKV